MKTTMNFADFKAEILKNAKMEIVGLNLTNTLTKVTTFQALCEIITNNFDWFADKKIITGELLEAVGNEELNKWHLAVNKSVDSGYLFAYGNAKIKVYGAAIVIAYNNVIVIAHNNINVKAFDNVNVIAFDNVTVKAFDNVKVRAFDNVKVRACNTSYVLSFENSMVKNYGNAKVIKI
jgi:hypothetical protein